MQKSLLAVLAVLLVAGSVPAIIVETLDYFSDASAIASQMSLNLNLPEGGLAAFWPEEVEKLANLPPIIATIKDPTKLNAAIGEGANLAKGDFLVLRAADRGFTAQVCTRGLAYIASGTSMACPNAPAEVSNLMGTVGISLKVWGDPHVNESDGGKWSLFMGTVSDPTAFDGAFEGEGEVTKGQKLLVRIDENGTRAWCTVGHNSISELTLACVKGAVEVVKK